jgi:regulator of cell morphogenesis and NO signaling
MKATKAQVKKMTIGQIAASVPYAAQLFYKYKLDFCCHGDISLHEACVAKGADERAVLAELQGLMRSKEKTEWKKMNEHDLVQHILDAYHAELYACVPEILRLATKVEVVHADHPECPNGLTRLVQNFWKDLEAHLQKEELFVFPKIEANQDPDAGQYLQQVMREHVEQGAALQKIRSVCHGYKPPVKACRTWQSLYLSLERLERDLMEHIHVENNVLFERALGTSRPVPALHG